MAAGNVNSALLGKTDKQMRPATQTTARASASGGWGVGQTLGLLDGVMGTVGSVAGIGGMVFGLGGMAAGAVAYAATGAGEKLGFKPLQAVGENVRGGINFLETTTVAQAFGGPGSRTVSEVAQHTANIAAKPLGAVSKVPGLGALKADNIKKIPSQIGQSSLMHAGLNGAFIAASAASLYHVTRDFGGLIENLRLFEEDLSGKPVSTAEVLAGTLSKPGREIRSHLLKTSGAHFAAETASLGVNIGMAFSNSLGALTGMALYAAPDMLGQMADGMFGESILPMYKSLRDAQATGAEIPPAAIAQFILAANEKLRNRGRTGAQFAEALAKEYLGEETKLAAIVQEVYSGDMQKRIDRLTHEHDAKASSHHLSHVERLSKQPLAERPVVGDFTQRIKQASAAGISPPTLH